MVDVMSDVMLSATPMGNGFQATIVWPGGLSVSSATAYPSRSEAITAAAFKLLDETRRLDSLDNADDQD
jgi:hypothetical protein